MYRKPVFGVTGKYRVAVTGLQSWNKQRRRSSDRNVVRYQLGRVHVCRSSRVSLLDSKGKRRSSQTVATDSWRSSAEPVTAQLDSKGLFDGDRSRISAAFKRWWKEEASSVINQCLENVENSYNLTEVVCVAINESTRKLWWWIMIFN